MARRRTVTVPTELSRTPETPREGLTWYGLTAPTHDHTCSCGFALGCAKAQPCPITPEWKCRACTPKGDCAWCNGTGTYTRAHAEPSGNVPCGYCAGTGRT